MLLVMKVERFFFCHIILLLLLLFWLSLHFISLSICATYFVVPSFDWFLFHSCFSLNLRVLFDNDNIYTFICILYTHSHTYCGGRKYP